MQLVVHDQVRVSYLFDPFSLVESLLVLVDKGVLHILTLVLYVLTDYQLVDVLSPVHVPILLDHVVLVVASLAHSLPLLVLLVHYSAQMEVQQLLVG